MKKKSAESGLTDLESHVLAVVWRDQPTTAYRVRHAFGASPTRDFALSQGSIYPAIDRLKKRGFVSSLLLDDRRGTEQLRCTEPGESAIRAWLRAIPSQLPEDPLRNRILFMALLDAGEREAWLSLAREQLLRSLADVEEFSLELTGGLAELAHDNARSTLLARIRWLERISEKLPAAD